MNIEHAFRAAEAAAERTLFTRASAALPTDIFVGKADGRLAIEIRSQDAPPHAPHLAALSISISRSPRGYWSILLSLLRSELRFLFIRLAEDLVRATAHGSSNAGAVVVQRLLQWQRLLAPGPREALSEAQLRGLLGELLFLRDQAIPALGETSAILGWKGPFNAPRDFEFADRDVEVKTIREGARTIQVSSLEQLDTDVRPVFMWVTDIALRTCARGVRPASSAANLVADLRQQALSDAIASEHLEQGLLAAGYSDCEAYEEQEIVSGRTWCIAIREAFPRITRGATPPGVTSCNYDISWPVASQFAGASWHSEGSC